MAAMRLRTVRLKGLPRTPDEAYVVSQIVRDLMIAQGCYLEKAYDWERDCILWVARYA